MEKLKKYNAWGTVSINGQEITVILTAVNNDGKPINRTIRQTCPQTLDITGTDIIAVNIKEKGQEIAVRALGEKDVTSSPDVKRVVKDAIDWIRKSADI